MKLQKTDLLESYLPGSFTQWMAGNADHNPMMIDGRGSFHSMGVGCQQLNLMTYISRI